MVQPSESTLNEKGKSLGGLAINVFVYYTNKFYYNLSTRFNFGPVLEENETLKLFSPQRDVSVLGATTSTANI